MWLSSGNTEHDLCGAEESTIFTPKIHDHIDNETDKTEHAFGDVYFASTNNLSNSRTLCGLIKERMSFGVDSTVYVWGNSSKGRLGPYPSHQPTAVKNRVLSGMRVIDVACSKNFSLILLAHGDVYVLGNNDKHDKAYGKPNLVQELFSVRIIQIGCFGQNGCIALSNSGDLYHWSATTDMNHSIPKLLSNKVSRIISCDEQHICFATQANKVFLCGPSKTSWPPVTKTHKTEGEWGSQYMIQEPHVIDFSQFNGKHGVLTTKDRRVLVSKNTLQFQIRGLKDKRIVKSVIHNDDGMSLSSDGFLYHWKPEKLLDEPILNFRTAGIQSLCIGPEFALILNDEGKVSTVNITTRDLTVMLTKPGAWKAVPGNFVLVKSTEEKEKKEKVTEEKKKEVKKRSFIKSFFT